ncbi:MAG: protein-glutamate methylesterase/protein-glutamine glutaminase [Kiloniellales bacterium]
MSAEYRVMVVDDSAVTRGLLAKTLESDNDVKVVTTVANGALALKALETHYVEVAVLDIEMPVMDGLTALPKLLAKQPGLRVIMASTLTVKNAEISLRALQAGAADYITKPSSSGGPQSAATFKRELVAKVKALAEAVRGRATARTRTVERSSGGAVVPAIAPKTFQLRKISAFPPSAIAIGSSTGGPQALNALVSKLGGPMKQPIFITQHMPGTFTALLAQHLARSSGILCAEGRDGEKVTSGRIYLAPGDRHMLIEEKGGSQTIRLSQAPPENFCRPAVDPMLRSLVPLYGPRLLVVMLTGMGTDGCKGAEAVVKAGGSVIAQDEASSVVWGMPGAVAMAGLCSTVLPLPELAPYIRKLVMRSAA